GASGTARPSGPPRARWKCAASPCCRTSRNGHKEHSGWEPPTHKIANRSRGSARAEEVLPRPGSRVHCAFGSAEDCRYDKLDKSNSFTPGKFQQKHTRCLAGKASSICSKLICRVECEIGSGLYLEPSQ